MRMQFMKKIVTMIVLASMLVTLVTGCAKKDKESKELSTNGFAFNTTYTITLYQGGTQKLLNACVAKCAEYENVFSRTSENSELYQVNEIEKLYEKVIEGTPEYARMSDNNTAEYKQSQCTDISNQINQMKSDKNEIAFQIAPNGSISFTVSKLLQRIVERGLEYSQKSDGKFDIAIEPVSSLWNFTAEDPKVPDTNDISSALGYIDYKKVSVGEKKIVFSEAGMGLDLGGIAKGFIADELKSYLKDNGVTSALINLGGNILCLGRKDNKKNFAVGIQQPFADRNETVAAVSVNDLSIVSSGIYERYFEAENGKMYHHILNPKTGYSYDNDLMAVTILSKKSTDGDGLSTTCFALGREEGMRYINSLEDVEALFITKDEKLWYTDGFKQYLMEN